MSRDYEIGERVIAATHGTGQGRSGVVVGRLVGPDEWFRLMGGARYVILFDGDRGHSGPCAVIRAEGEREDVSPTIGTAA